MAISNSVFDVTTQVTATGVRAGTSILPGAGEIIAYLGLINSQVPVSFSLIDTAPVAISPIALIKV